MVQQHSALAGGDPAQIAAKSKTLHAVALRELAQVFVARGDAGGAIDLYRQSLALSPSLSGHLELASALLRSGAAKAAADEALTATEMDPQSAAAWAVRGGALRADKREADAVVALRESLRLHGNADVAYALGTTLLALHEQEQADNIFQKLLTASGNAAIWYVEVGDAYREADYIPQALAAFQEAIRRDPRVPHAEFFLGITYLERNEWGPNSESFRHLREAVRLAPRDYVSNFYLGALESTDGSDLASSDRHLRTAAEVDPSQPEVWLYLGLNANREHRTADAKTDLRKTIDLTGRDESRNNYQVRKAYFALGRLLVADGDRVEGSKLLARYSAAEQAAVAESGAKIQGQAAGQDGSSKFPARLESGMLAGRTGVEDLASNGGLQQKSASDSQRPSVERMTAKEQQALTAREAALRHVLATSGNDLGTAEAREQHYPEALATFEEGRAMGGPRRSRRCCGMKARRLSGWNASTRHRVRSPNILR